MGLFKKSIREGKAPAESTTAAQQELRPPIQPTGSKAEPAFLNNPT